MKKENRNTRKKKIIQDCIDIDGLTKVEDNSCRKLIQKDEQYKVGDSCKLILK